MLLITGIFFIINLSSGQDSSLTQVSFTQETFNSYLDWLLPTDDNMTKMSELKTSLPLLHCNTYCNGSTETQIAFRECSAATPACKPCHCDDICDKYGDCCPDEKASVRMRKQMTYQCVRPKQDKYYFWGVYGSYFMITACPEGKATPECEIKRNEVAPVTSYTSEITYINKHIANCNDDTNYQAWSRESICPETGLEDKQTLDDCWFYFYPPLNLPVRSCNYLFSDPEFAKYIESCNVTGLWNGSTLDIEVDVQCKEWYYYPVAGGGYVFKNFYCFLCNGLTPSAAHCYGKFQVFAADSINSLIRLTPGSYRPVCKEYEWYDRIKNVCRYLSCPQGYQLEDRRCEMTMVSLPSVQYHLTVEFWSTKQQMDAQFLSWGDIETLSTENIPDIMTENNISDYVFTVDSLAPNDKINTTELYPSLRLTLMFRTKQNCCRLEFELEISKLLQEPWTFRYNGSSTEFDVSYSETPNAIVTDSETYKVISPDVVPERINLYSSLSDYVGRTQEYIYLPIVYPRCTYVSLYAGEFEWNIDKSVTLSYADIRIPYENFTEIRKDELAICVDMLKIIYKDYQLPVDPMKRAENIVSLFFSILSLVCLTLTFITYCTFPSLLTLPTKNTMCLVVSLFVAQLLLQFMDLASRDETTCKVIGVLLHYSWLSVILWMNVCSYHMFHVFVIDAAKPMDIQSHRSRLLRYFVYANGTSLIIVIVTVGVNLGVTSGNQIGYGNGTCYLSTFLLVGVSFVLPLGIVLILNIFFFSITVWTMAKINKMSATIGQDKGQVHIYIKLSTLTGIFWTLSILAENLHLQFLIFISIILNASQGVFIFFSYMANRRVYQLWKGKCLSSSVQTDSNQTLSTQL